MVPWIVHWKWKPSVTDDNFTFCYMYWKVNYKKNWNKNTATKQKRTYASKFTKTGKTVLAWKPYNNWNNFSWIIFVIHCKGQKGNYFPIFMITSIFFHTISNSCVFIQTSPPYPITPCKWGVKHKLVILTNCFLKTCNCLLLSQTYPSVGNLLNSCANFTQ